MNALVVDHARSCPSWNDRTHECAQDAMSSDCAVQSPVTGHRTEITSVPIVVSLDARFCSKLRERSYGQAYERVRHRQEPASMKQISLNGLIYPGFELHLEVSV